MQAAVVSQLVQPILSQGSLHMLTVYQDHVFKYVQLNLMEVVMAIMLLSTVLIHVHSSSMPQM